jgi:hypothetical protein
VGGVSEGAGAKARGVVRAISPRPVIPPRVVTVEDIPVFWKAALFAGRRRNEGLGRSVAFTGILRGSWRADDSGCPKDAEKGNVVGMRHKAHAPDLGTRDRTYFTGTRPSLGPSTRAR